MHTESNMAATAALLLKESATTCLSALAERSRTFDQLNLPEYELRLSSDKLELISRCPPTNTDEGFESDADSASLSSVGSTSSPDTDSANGSAASDSDTETHETSTSTIIEAKLTTPPTSQHQRLSHEYYDLVDCVCYTCMTNADILIFVIKSEALVFRFASLSTLRHFYANFTALKALTFKGNASTITNADRDEVGNTGGKFNLLQHTDRNGVTHIEITRPSAPNRLVSNTGGDKSSIISINTPEIYCPNLLVNSVPGALRKVWNSAEDVLSAIPKRPERRRRGVKGRAPPPPLPTKPTQATEGNCNILKGEFVKVNVDPSVLPLHGPNSRWGEFLVAKSGSMDDFGVIGSASNTGMKNLFLRAAPKPKTDSTWTGSVPRLLQKQRSRSETRNFAPMAYRYIDTTPSYPPLLQFASLTTLPAAPSPNQMSNRLFGLSPKLREFSDVQSANDTDQPCDASRLKNASLSNSSTLKKNALKSVIKRDQMDFHLHSNVNNIKKKNEKKVTFSAYATVQVV